MLKTSCNDNEKEQSREIDLYATVEKITQLGFSLAADSFITCYTLGNISEPASQSMRLGFSSVSLNGLIPSLYSLHKYVVSFWYR